MKPVVLSKDLVQEMLAVTGLYRQAAKIIGVDVSTLIVVAESYGVPVKRRSKIITAKLRAEITAEPRNIAASVLADRYHISVTSINRIRRGVRKKEESNLF